MKLDEIVGLYLNPPAQALVFSVDEKSQIQALDRTQPGLPIKKGRAGTMTHDYKRNGTTTLFAALCTLTGHGADLPSHAGSARAAAAAGVRLMICKLHRSGGSFRGAVAYCLDAARDREAVLVAHRDGTTPHVHVVADRRPTPSALSRASPTVAWRTWASHRSAHMNETTTAPTTSGRAAKLELHRAE